MAIQELFSSRNNHITDANAFVGQEGRLFYDPVSRTFRQSDGVTPGGIVVGGAPTANISSNSNVSISVLSTDGSTINSWSFNNDGTLSTPNYKFPLEDGAADQVIATDGAGTLYWTDQTGGGGGGGNPIGIKDEGTTLTADVRTINFTGAGIAATHVGNAVTVSVSKGAGINKIVDVSDVYVGTGLVNGDLLVYNYASERWDTKTELPSVNLDGGEF